MLPTFVLAYDQQKKKVKHGGEESGREIGWVCTAAVVAGTVALLDAAGNSCLSVLLCLAGGTTASLPPSPTAAERLDASSRSLFTGRASVSILDKS